MQSRSPNAKEKPIKNLKSFRWFSCLLAAILAIPVAMVSPSNHAHVATISWTSAVSGNWSDGTKWSGGGAPTSADDVLIPNNTRKIKLQ